MNPAGATRWRLFCGPGHAHSVRSGSEVQYSSSLI